MSPLPFPSRSSLPAADARLVAPDSRYEIEDGRVKYVAPADEPHGTRRSKISALLEAHAGADFEVASDMLTRTSEFDDMAPDVSVFPSERDEGGGRKLEQLAFEVASTESLSEAGRKANKLVGRGVRRDATRRIEGRVARMAEGLIAVLTARGLALEPAQVARVLADRDTVTIREWLIGAATCASLRELIGG
jgi:Putative restriction endonuclease